MKNCIIFVCLFLSFKSWGLVPLESLILGDFSDELKNNNVNPLGNIYDLSERESRIQFKRVLSKYRGMTQEGENLLNYCKLKYKTHYPHPWDRDTVKRSIIATLQYIGLDVISMALPEYAKYFNFNKTQYGNLVDGLVTNYCSDNLSLISKDQLKVTMKAEFEKSLSYSLPTLVNNPLFPDNFKAIFNEEKVMEREFSASLNVFKSFCSWGAGTEDLRLMTPFLKNPVTMTMVIQHLTQKELNWESTTNQLSKEHKEDTIHVYCNDMICRKIGGLDFIKKIPRMIGTQSIEEDIKRLYCEDFLFHDFVTVNQPPKIKKMMTEFNEFDFNLMVGHLNSLIIGIPEFFNWVDKPSDLLEYLRYGVDDLWHKWAMMEIQNKDRQFFYEEPLTIELVDRKLYLKESDNKVKIVFDVNLGEYDRANQLLGKLKTKFSINMNSTYLKYLKDLFKMRGGEELKKEAANGLITRLRGEIKEKRKLYEIPPWKGPLEKLVAKEIINQLVVSDINLKEKILTIPIEINYGAFALKYIRYKYQMNQQKKNLKDNDLIKDSKSL